MTISESGQWVLKHSLAEHVKVLYLSTFLCGDKKYAG